MEHTPMHIQTADLGHRTEYYIVNDKGNLVCRMLQDGIDPKTNAESIVRELNSHEPLLEACSDTLTMLEGAKHDESTAYDWLNGHGELSDCIKKLKAAIALAEGEEG